MEGRPSGRWSRPDLTAAEICAELNRAGGKYLVMGGIACILHGHIRATTDLDILIERTEENAARILEALEGVGYSFAREWDPSEIIQKPITIIGDDPAVDIFTVAWSVKYVDAVVRSSTVEVRGVAIPLISLEDLIASKRTGRAQDTADIEVLEEIRRLRAL